MTDQSPTSDRDDRPAGTRSIESLTDEFRRRDYIADRSLTTAVFLALELGRPLLLEGEAGVGKTELAKVLAASLGARLIRLQRYVVQELLGTLLPTKGATGFGNYGDGVTESERSKVNAWIRSQAGNLKVVDFDAALRDPFDPARLTLGYDSSDHVHPNSAGYQAMADAPRARGARQAAVQKAFAACRAQEQALLAASTAEIGASNASKAVADGKAAYTRRVVAAPPPMS